jgi:hypothetical protein
MEVYSVTNIYTKIVPFVSVNHPPTIITFKKLLYLVPPGFSGSWIQTQEL